MSIKNNDRNAPYGWYVLVLTLVFQAISYGLITYSFALYVVPWQQEFEAPVRDIMLGIAILQLSAGVQSAFVGRALDKFSPRLIIILGAALLGLGFGLMSLAIALWQIIALYATLIPAAIAMTGPVVAQSLVMRWFAEKRGLAMGLSAVGTSIGGLIFPILIGAMLVSVGWRQSLLLLPTIGAVLIIVSTYFILAKQPPSSANPTLAGDGSSPAGDARQWSTKAIFFNQAFWILVLAFIPLIATYSAVQFNFGPFMAHLGYQPEDTALLISIVALSMLVGKLLLGYLADHIDVRLLYAVSVLAMVAVLLLLKGEPSLALIRLCAGFLGLAIGGYTPLSGLIIGMLFGMVSFGRVMGLFTMLITLGAFGSILAGWIYDKTGSFDTVFSVFLVVLIAPSLAMIFLKIPEKAAAHG